MANYLSADVLSILEREYGAGNFSAAAVRQHLMWLTASLEPEDQQEFLSEFKKLDVRGGPLSGACAKAKQEMLTAVASVASASASAVASPIRTSQQIPQSLDLPSPGVGVLTHSTPNGATAHSQPLFEPASPAPNLIAAEHIREVSQRHIMKAFGKDLSPLQPAEDDADGVARVRITMLFSVSEHAHAHLLALFRFSVRSFVYHCCLLVCLLRFLPPPPPL